MEQELTQHQIGLLTNVIEDIYIDVHIGTHHGIPLGRLHSFEDTIVKAFVGERRGEEYAFVALKVDKCPERDCPWICWTKHVSSWWDKTDEVETETRLCMEANMADVSEQVKMIYSTFLI